MPVKEYLEAKETELVEDQAETLTEKVLIRLLRRLGCRVSEALGIEEQRIDFSRRIIRIEHEKMRISLYCPFCPQDPAHRTRLSKKAVFCQKCGKEVAQANTKEKQELHLRKIPVDPDTLDLLREYIKKGGVTDVGGHRMLFTQTRQWAWGVVKRCAERAGFKELENPENEKKHHVHPHSFRDAWVINAMSKHPTQDDARIIQEQLGHQNINTTMRYRKVSMTELKKFNEDLLQEEK
jgi:integrase/recombinase XerD